MRMRIVKVKRVGRRGLVYVQVGSCCFRGLAWSRSVEGLREYRRLECHHRGLIQGVFRLRVWFFAPSMAGLHRSLEV
jgi:hypothetical protein